MSRRATDGGVKKCRIHDLLRDLCISESKEDKFLALHRAGNLSFPIKSRRVSFHGDDSSLLYNFSNVSDPPCARSLLFFGYFKDMNWNLFIKNFKLIQVLNFATIGFHSIPKSIETMIHLRYLSIKLSDSVSVIPDSFGNLRNLEILFIKGRDTVLDYQVSGIAGIFQLQRLRKLYLKDFLPLPCHLDEVLRNLQVLSTSTCCYDGEQTFPLALDKFPCLRELTIRFIYKQLNSDESEKTEEFLNSLKHLVDLQILKLELFPILPSALSSFPLTITQITLNYVSLREGGGMTVLGNLPNLRILKIKRCGISNLHILGDSFPRLEVLKLRDLELVEEWKQEEGAILPCLRYLVIEGCLKLTKLPPELWSLTALQKVEVLRPNPELERMLRELQMTVSCKLVIDSVDLQPSSVGSSADIIRRPILQVYFYFSFYFCSHF